VRADGPYVRCDRCGTDGPPEEPMNKSYVAIL
jgi:hypothetical protein